MKKVLIVDDSKTIQRMVASCVKSLGGEVVAIANDGEEGVQKFKELSPDLVLLDITMPNKDGRECLRDIIAHNPRAVVVMLSALNSEAVIKECLQLGAKAFIDKMSIGQSDALAKELIRYIQPEAA